MLWLTDTSLWVEIIFSLPVRLYVEIALLQCVLITVPPESMESGLSVCEQVKDEHVATDG